MAGLHLTKRRISFGSPRHSTPPSLAGLVSVSNLAVVGRKEISAAALWTCVGRCPPTTFYQAGSPQVSGTVARAAADADVRASGQVSGLVSAKIVSPSVHAEPRAQVAVDGAQRESRQPQYALMAAAQQEELLLDAGHIPAIEKRESGMQQHRSCKWKSSGGGDEFRKFASPRKGIDMATATPEPTVNAVRQSGRIGNRDKNGAGGFDRAAQFFERLPQIYKMFKAMICYYDVETLVAQWHSSRIRLKKFTAPVGRLRLQIHAHQARSGQVRIETAG